MGSSRITIDPAISLLGTYPKGQSQIPKGYLYTDIHSRSSQESQTRSWQRIHPQRLKENHTKCTVSHYLALKRKIIQIHIQQGIALETCCQVRDAIHHMAHVVRLHSHQLPAAPKFTETERGQVKWGRGKGSWSPLGGEFQPRIGEAALQVGGGDDSPATGASLWPLTLAHLKVVVILTFVLHTRTVVRKNIKKKYQGNFQVQGLTYFQFYCYFFMPTLS